MARIYVAGPLFCEQDRSALKRLADALEGAGHATFLPHRDAGDDAAGRGPDDAAGAEARRRRVFQADLEGLRGCDGVVALLDGADVDAGTAFEIGWAYANDRPVMGVRTDFRTLGPEGPVSLMVYAACRPMLHVPGGSWQAVEEGILDWAAGVRPWGGRLVRDGVPRIVAKRGADLRFRRVDPSGLPRALKAKMHELSRVLEERGVEKEADTVVDLLQAVETLIEARGWDRDTLRALKKRRWKDRGGYGEGWVVEDGTLEDGAGDQAEDDVRDGAGGEAVADARADAPEQTGGGDR